ncbi:peptidylprolyl isomerase [Psychromonas aquimarina]|uniref:peptidylprolyl isomerase n=1 Tax=Psychromonas aquimarina TaxID=444919 RepID=UPI0003FC295B|nr:peptidylprolyl isomerase [Psychromonas aquimarina]
MLKNKFGIVIAVLTLLSACSDSGDDKVIAKVGDVEITKIEFEHYLKLKNIPLDNKKHVENALSAYLNRTAIVQNLEQQAVYDKASLEAEVNEFKKQTLLTRHFEKVLKDKVNEQAVRNFYNTHQEQFQSKKANVAHILIRTNAKMSDAEKQARLNKAHEAYSRLTANEKFADIAEIYSEDKRSAKNAGELGWIKEGAISPAFSAKAFSLAQNEISPPFATSFGIHIVKVLQPSQIITSPFESVKGDIRYQLRQQVKQAENERLLAAVEIERMDKADE